MATHDLQRVDQLVHNADMAVRTASQLRLWLKRRNLQDIEAVEEARGFVSEAVEAGQFVQNESEDSGFASLSPLTWSADVKYGSRKHRSPAQAAVEVEYGSLVSWLTSIHATLEGVLHNQVVEPEAVLEAANYFDKLGRNLGSKADNVLQGRSSSQQVFADDFLSR